MLSSNYNSFYYISIAPQFLLDKLWKDKKLRILGKKGKVSLVSLKQREFMSRYAHEMRKASRYHEMLLIITIVQRRFQYFKHIISTGGYYAHTGCTN